MSTARDEKIEHSQYSDRYGFQFYQLFCLLTRYVIDHNCDAIRNLIPTLIDARNRLEIKMLVAEVSRKPYIPSKSISSKIEKYQKEIEEKTSQLTKLDSEHASLIKQTDQTKTLINTQIAEKNREAKADEKKDVAAIRLYEFELKILFSELKNLNQNADNLRAENHRLEDTIEKNNTCCFSSTLDQLQADFKSHQIKIAENDKLIKLKNSEINHKETQMQDVKIRHQRINKSIAELQKQYFTQIEAEEKSIQTFIQHKHLIEAERTANKRLLDEQLAQLNTKKFNHFSAIHLNEVILHFVRAYAIYLEIKTSIDKQLAAQPKDKDHDKLSELQIYLAEKNSIFSDLINAFYCPNSSDISAMRILNKFMKDNAISILLSSEKLEKDELFTENFINQYVPYGQGTRLLGTNNTLSQFRSSYFKELDKSSATASNSTPTPSIANNL